MMQNIAGGGQPRLAQGQNNLHQNPQSRPAIHQHGFIQFLGDFAYEAVQQPDCKRQIERQVRNHQTEPGVDEVNIFHQNNIWQGHGDSEASSGRKGS